MSEIAIAMPQISSHVKDEVSFTVINQDNLPVNMTISGEQILKPFGSDAQKMKPNVIVHPTRRLPANPQKNNQLEDSTIDLHKYVIEDKIRNKRNSFRNRNNSRVKMKIEELKNQLGSNFNKVLDFKLRRLQNDKKYLPKDNITNNSPRKPFVTTVKRGLFLEPPPDIENLVGVKVDEPTFKKEKEAKKLYAFASQPRVLNRSSPKNLHYARCEAAAKAAGKLVEAIVGYKNRHDGDYSEFHDVSASYLSAAEKAKPKTNNNHYGPQQLEPGKRGSASARAREARRRALARKKAKTQQIKTDTPSCITQHAHIRKRRDVRSDETQEMWTQTDTSIPVPTLRGEDVGTQINPGDLFNFDIAVQPILEVLVGKTIEQALIEVLEEEELVALGEQQRRYLESRVTESQTMSTSDSMFMKIDKGRREDTGKQHEDAEDNVSTAMRIQDTVAHLLPSILEYLEDKGFSMEAFKKDFDVSFLPWLLKEIMLEVQDMVSSRDVLTDIVKEILENREEIDRVIRKRSIEDTDEDMDFMPRHDIKIVN